MSIHTFLGAKYKSNDICSHLVPFFKIQCIIFMHTIIPSVFLWIDDEINHPYPSSLLYYNYGSHTVDPLHHSDDTRVMASHSTKQRVHRWPLDYCHKRPIKRVPLHDIIMACNKYVWTDHIDILWMSRDKTKNDKTICIFVMEYWINISHLIPTAAMEWYSKSHIHDPVCFISQQLAAERAFVWHAAQL